MDPLLCCAMGLCCPPFSAEQEKALTRVLVREGVDANSAGDAAAAILKHFALAPKSMAPVIAEIAAAAKGHKG